MRTMEWKELSTSITSNPQSSLHQIYQNSCRQSNSHAHRLDTSLLASLINPPNPLTYLLPLLKLPTAPEVHITTPPPVAPAVPPTEPAPPCRRSPRLHPEQGQAHAILSRPATRSPASQSQSKPRPRAVNSSSHQCSKMARIHPLTVGYTEAVGPKANPLSFTSLRLVDLHNGRSQYLKNLQKLADALPKTEDPTTRFALRGNLARPGIHRLRRSMRAAIWFLLPSDGTFIRNSSSLHYYLARQ